MPPDRSGYPALRDNVLVLTREKIEEALGAQSWTILPLRLTDSSNGNLRYDGDYTMYILVERIN